MPWTFKSCAYKLEGEKHINIYLEAGRNSGDSHSSCMRSRVLGIWVFFGEYSSSIAWWSWDAFVNNIVWMVATRPSSSLVPEPCFLNTTRICLSSCFSHLAHHRHVLLGCHVLPKTKGETWPNRSRAQAQSSIQCITLHKLHYPA